MNEISGVVNVLKPPEMSSHGVVNALRRLFELKRVGHTGTLDPGAAGVLPICIGRATKITEYLMDKDKTYYAHLVFGRSTDTYDSYGTTIESSDKSVNIEELKKILPDFTGEIEQVIPAFSAKKVNGQKLYDLARKGESINNITKKVTVNSLDVICEIDPNIFLLKINCSMGTYIRSICNDIGKSLGIPSHMGALVRTKSGNFQIEDAFTLDELSNMKEAGCLEKTVITMNEALCNYPTIHVFPEYKQYVINGRKIPIEKAILQADPLKKNIYRCYCDEVFYGIASVNEQLICLEKLLNLDMG